MGKRTIGCGVSCFLGYCAYPQRLGLSTFLASLLGRSFSGSDNYFQTVWLSTQQVGLIAAMGSGGSTVETKDVVKDHHEMFDAFTRAVADRLQGTQNRF